MTGSEFDWQSMTPSRLLPCAGSFTKIHRCSSR